MRQPDDTAKSNWDIPSPPVPALWFENPVAPRYGEPMSPLTDSSSTSQWLCAGDEIFPAMLAAIGAASVSVCLEVYTFEESPLGREFLETLARARERGCRVRVLVDAVGSVLLPNDFWEPLRRAGGEVRCSIRSP